MAMRHLFTAKQVVATRIWSCVPTASLITLKLVITGCTETLLVYVPMGGGGAPALLTQLAISSLPHIYQELSFLFLSGSATQTLWLAFYPHHAIL